MSRTHAVKLGSEALGAAHPDAIITRHNLAELFIALGDETSALEVQEHLLELLGVDADDVQEVPSDQAHAGTIEVAGDPAPLDVKVVHSKPPATRALTPEEQEDRDELEYLNSLQPGGNRSPGAPTSKGAVNDIATSHEALARSIHQQKQHSKGAAPAEDDDSMWGFDPEEAPAPPKSPPITFATRKKKPSKK